MCVTIVFHALFLYPPILHASIFLPPNHYSFHSIVFPSLHPSLHLPTFPPFLLPPYTPSQYILQIPIIDIPGLGNLSAVTACEVQHVTSQNDKQNLEKAKAMTYLKGFYEGVRVL